MKPNTHTRTISSSKCIQESHQVVCVAKLLNQFHSPVYALIQFMIQLILDSLIKFPSQTNSVRLWSKSFSIATSTKVKRWNVVQGEGNLPQKSTFCLKKYPPKKKLDGFIDCTAQVFSYIPVSLVATTLPFVSFVIQLKKKFQKLFLYFWASYLSTTKAHFLAFSPFYYKSQQQTTDKLLHLVHAFFTALNISTPKQITSG